MTTLYFDENTGWVELNETVDEALRGLRDDGNVRHSTCLMPDFSPHRIP
jgi:hypothetical protein